MSKISLIALDLDGTLLNSEKKISPRNRAALAAAQAQGVKVVLTTGRPLKAMDFLLEELGTAGLKEEYTITFNGGLVQRNNGEILSKVVLAPEDVATIHDETARLGLPLDAISEGTVYEIYSEWCPKNVHKATGLEALAAILGLTSDQVMACGDEANDLSMIQWAGLGVAMGNAVPAVKEVAALVAPVTNDQDAVAWAIENYVLKESE